jgi:photosystem II stability/assembly factor-like uncharacterized protein
LSFSWKILGICSVLLINADSLRFSFWKEIFSFDSSIATICTSANGKYVSAGGTPSTQTNGAIYGSSDSGNTWNVQLKLDPTKYGGIAYIDMSKDGKYRTAVIYNKAEVTTDLYYSLDFGETWELSQGNNDPNSPIVYIYMNASGNIQYATSGSSWIGGTVPNNGVWLSTDFGVTWEKIFTLNNVTFQYITTNGDGSIVQVSVTEADGKSTLYYSKDFGITWVISNTPDVTLGPSYMSSSGQYQTLIYSERNDEKKPGTLYSVDYGANWSKSDFSTVYGGNIKALDLAMDSSANYQIAASVGNLPSKGFQIYVSEILL